MPRCYLLAVMRGSSLDTSSNNWTLFSLIEQRRIPKFPAVLPLEIHTYWQFAPDEMNVDFEFRMVFVPDEGNETVSQSVSLKSKTRRLRMRLHGIPIAEPREYELRVEWRELHAAEWTRADIFWPLQVEMLTESEKADQERLSSS